MALATFKDLCMDASDSRALADFWATVLGREAEHLGDDSSVVRGPRPIDTLWVNRVAESRQVKHRVHLDLSVGSLAPLQDAGATVLREQGDGIAWTVMADPEGGEFCAFVRDDRPEDAPGEPYEMVVDTTDSAASRELADWWADVLGGRSVDDGRGFWWVEDVESFPFATLDVIPVEEPKQVKNRIHWDLFCDDVPALVDRGARLRRKPDVDVGWHVLVDPQGNEFCTFPTTPD